MKILAIERDIPGTREEDFTADLLKEEALRAWQLHRSGGIRELYFRTDRHAAVLVLECDSTEQARTLLSTLPLVQKGLIDLEVIPLMAYPGFERLFNT
jgi:muconolactone delta-isomerase